MRARDLAPMPANNITLTVTNDGCGAFGGRVDVEAHVFNYGVGPSVSVEIRDEVGATVALFSANGASYQHYFEDLPSGVLAVEATNQDGDSVVKYVTIDCGPSGVDCSFLGVSPVLATNATASIPTGSATFTVQTNVATFSATLEDLALIPSLTDVAPGQHTLAGIPTGIHHFVVTDAQGCVRLSEDFAVLPYSPGGGGGDGGGGGVLVPAVSIVAAPANYAPVHRPVLVVLAVSGLASGVPGIVRAILEVQPYGTDAWVEVARLQQTASTISHQVQWNLSEYLKDQFGPLVAPPVLNGLNPELTVLWRLRYVLNAPFPEEGGATLGPLFVRNATTILPSDLTLHTPAYTTRPVGRPVPVFSIDEGTGLILASNPLSESAAWPCDAKLRQFFWLTRSGIFDTGFFSGRHEYSTDTQGNTFRGLDNADRYADRTNTRRTVNVYSDRLTGQEFDVLVGIRDSLQVFEYANGAFIPVLIPTGSFRDYGVRDKVFGVDFTVLYPVEQIQTQ